MKLTKQILSFVIVVLLVINCVPFAYATKNNTLTIIGELDKAVIDVEYGWDGTKYRFPDNILKGVQEDDDVYLVADAETTDSLSVGSNVNLKLSNFKIEGKDASNYSPPSNLSSISVEKKIKITKKTIEIAPEDSYIYFGQKTEFTKIADYKSQIVNDEDVSIEATFWIKMDDSQNDVSKINGYPTIGDYSLTLKNSKFVGDNPKVTGADAENYKVILDSDAKCSVLPYETNEIAISKEVSNGNYIGVNSVVLNAPEGFKISKNNNPDYGWSDSIIVPLKETYNGSHKYYLRNNKPSEEFYQAISGPKIYNYTSAQTIPIVKSIKIEKVDDKKKWNFLSSSVISGSDLVATVYVQGGALAQDTVIYLSEEKEGDYKSELVPARNAVFLDGKYTYTASFELNVEEGKVATKNLKAYAMNFSGKGDIYPAEGTKDTFVGTNTQVDKPIKIDKKIPDVKITGIDGNYNHNSIKANFNISDCNVGVAKVEYLWDDGFLLNEGDAEYQTDYVEFNGYSKDKSEYELILPWNMAKTVPGNRHTLHLRVTDNVGNIYNDLYPLTDTVGSDMLKPNIESIEIREFQSDETNSVYFFTFGTFYKDAVEIAIKVNDNESEIDYYATGVKSVKVNDRVAIKNEENEENNEYILVVSPDDIIEGMRITVTDCNELTTNALATEVPEHGEINSNDLIIEDDPPTIDFGDIESKGHEDPEGRIWFGNGDNEDEMKITVADNNGTIKSGLYSVIIKDNDKEVYSNKNFDFKTIEDLTSFKIGDLKEDGEHIFTVEVHDNCGNISTKNLTFYRDTVEPEKGEINVDSPEGVWIDSKQWFDKEEVLIFCVNSSDSGAGVKDILLKINGKIFDYHYKDNDNNSDNDIILYEDNYYILVSTKDKGIEYDSEQKYTVTGTVTDFANNTLTLEKLTVYKDFEEPTIEKITVEKKVDTLDKVLNVLTFGVYSNNSIIVKAYTKDAEFDSGINYATVQYVGLSKPKKMVEEEGVFSVEIPESDSIFESDIAINVYDKYGKENLYCPNITKDEAVSLNKLIVIETVKPIITPSLPKDNRGILMSGNQLWYSGSNKDITFNVKDENSGINNIDFNVNNIDILKDKENVVLLKSSVSEAAASRNNDELIYNFDTDYFTSIYGEAEDGKYAINIKVTDNAGNSEDYTHTYYVDKTSPIIKSIEFNPETSDGNIEALEFIEELEYGYYFKTDFNVTINVLDDGPSSGLSKVNYRFVPYEYGKKQEETKGSQEIIDGKTTLKVPKGFKGQIFVEVFDNVGNRSGEKTARAYVIDSTAPAIKITNNANTDYRDANGNKLYVETNSFTVMVTDNVSGIKQIGYLQNSEQNSYDRKTIDIDNIEYNMEADLGDGWIVTGVDANLVTQVTKVFNFSTDNNDVILTFDATDNSHNKSKLAESEKFTVDKTAPIINVVFRDDDDTDAYYNQNRIADITVIDRNFDANLIKVDIKNDFGDVPGYSFAEQSKKEHIAVIDFDEGDYTFEVTGEDLGDHNAIVNFVGGNEELFYVDKTKPTIEENFAEFSNSAENSFNVDKTVNIRINEHNFDPELMNLKIFRKDSGAEHSLEGIEDVTTEVLGVERWDSTGDLHTLSFTFDRDAIYYLEINPVDLATNISEKHSTVIFEVDKTKPIVSMKNGSFVKEDDTAFLDVYTYERKDDPVPTVEFEDFNISYIKYKLSVYIPDYSTSDDVVIKPVVSSGIVNGNKYTLPEFTKDGVYAIELIAVDVAGNQSELNLNTYARMINQDVLAFIMDSNFEKKTGLYSFEYKNGEAISKKPSSFEDLKIFIMAKKDTPIDIVIRDANGKEILTNAQCTMDDSIYGIGIYNYLLKADFFKENFQDDVDVELILSVKNQGQRIDLGKMHIDNIVPVCDMPNELNSWHWFYGEEERTFTLSNISELINESHCKIYDNGKAIPFVYSSKDNTITFTLSKGWHNVGFVLVDMAGNTNNIQEKTNIHIGYFWLWIIIAAVVVITTIIICVVIYNRNRRKRELEEV